MPDSEACLARQRRQASSPGGGGTRPPAAAAPRLALRERWYTSPGGRLAQRRRYALSGGGGSHTSPGGYCAAPRPAPSRRRELCYTVSGPPSSCTPPCPATAPGLARRRRHACPAAAPLRALRRRLTSPGGGVATSRPALQCLGGSATPRQWRHATFLAVLCACSRVQGA